MLNITETWTCVCGHANTLGRHICKSCHAEAPTDIIARRRENPLFITNNDVEDELYDSALKVAWTQQTKTSVKSALSFENWKGREELPGQNREHERRKELTSVAEIPAESKPLAKSVPQNYVDAKTPVEQLKRDWAPEKSTKMVVVEERRLANGRAQDREKGADPVGMVAVQPDASDSESELHSESDSESIWNKDSAHNSNVQETIEPLPPGTLRISDVCHTSFTVEWEPPHQEHAWDSYRVVVFNEDRTVRACYLTAAKRWPVISLNAGSTFGVAITCRSLILRDFAPPSDDTYTKHEPDERLVPYFLPSTTLMTKVETQSSSYEYACFFDDPEQSTSWQLFYGKLNGGTGHFEQESTLSTLETATTHQIIGEPQKPAHAYSGVSALELFSPIGLSCGSFLDLPLKYFSSIYDFEVAIFISRPHSATDCFAAPAKSRHLVHRAHQAAMRRQKGEDAHTDDEKYDLELLDGGVTMIVRDPDTSQFVISEPVLQFGKWQKVNVQTEFPSQNVRVHVQVPCGLFGRVFVDNFCCSYVGPSALETEIDNFIQILSGTEDRSLCVAVQLCLHFAEDLVNHRGRIISKAVKANVYWGKSGFVGSTSKSLAASTSKNSSHTLNGSFKLPIEAGTGAHEELLIEVVDAYSLKYIGETKLRCRDVIHHTSSPRLHPIFSGKQHSRRKKGANFRGRRCHPKVGVATGTGDGDDEVNETDEETGLLHPVGRLALSVCCVYDAVDDKTFLQAGVLHEQSRPTSPSPSMSKGSNESLPQLRDMLLKRDRPGAAIRKVSRRLENSKREVDTLRLKGDIFKCGFADACISLLFDEKSGSEAADLILMLLQVSAGIMRQTRGTEVRSRLRDFCHLQGVGRALFFVARSRARALSFDTAASEAIVSNLEKRLDLVAAIYIPNRKILLSLIEEEIGCFELLVRLCAKSKSAQNLLMEVALGDTLPNFIVSEYFRLRRLLPLDAKYWANPTLSSLPSVLEPEPEYVFELNRQQYPVPLPAPPTCTELIVARIKKTRERSFVFLTTATMLAGIYQLLANSKCPLKLAATAGAATTLTLKGLLRFISKMRELGVASQVALVCSPFVACNYCMVVAFLGILMFLFAQDDGVGDSCTIEILWIYRMFMACYLLILASYIGDLIRRQFRVFCRYCARTRLICKYSAWTRGRQNQISRAPSTKVSTHDDINS